MMICNCYLLSCIHTKMKIKNIVSYLICYSCIQFLLFLFVISHSLENTLYISEFTFSLLKSQNFAAVYLSEKLRYRVDFWLNLFVLNYFITCLHTDFLGVSYFMHFRHLNAFFNIFSKLIIAIYIGRL